MREPDPIDLSFYPFLNLDPERARARWRERDLEAESRQGRTALIRAAVCLLVLFGGMALVTHWPHQAQQAATHRVLPG